MGGWTTLLFMHLTAPAQLPALPEVAVCRVLVVYEDAVTRGRAERALARIESSLGVEWEVESQSWSFAELLVPMCWRLACNEIDMVDVVIVAAHGQRAMPAGVRRLVDGLRQRDAAGEQALVALLDDGFGGRMPAGPVVACLRQVAVAGNLDFFCGGVDGWSRMVPLCSEAGDSATTGGMPVGKLVEEASIEAQPYRGFGIND